MRKEIFLLDLDDTLLDFKRTERKNLTETLKKYGIDVDEGLRKRYHDINEGLWKALERGEIKREEVKIKRFEILFEEYGLCADARAVSHSYFENFKNICIPFDGVYEFLKKLINVGKVYIVTNGGAAIQHRHVEDGGLSPYITDIFISEEIGHDKPSYEYAEHVAAHIKGFESEKAVWLGDSLTSDRLCAERLGVDFILFSPHGLRDYTGAEAVNYTDVLRLMGIE